MLWFYRSVKIILFIIFNKSNLIFFLSFSAGVIASVSNKSDIFTEFENTVKQLKETLANAVNATKGKDIASQTKNYFFTLIICAILIYFVYNFLKSQKGNPYEEDYKNALKGNDKLRALELGRLYYRWNRRDKALTVYDETAIANDLSIMKD